MVRVDLFHPWSPSVYGTATYQDILTVCGAALGFCTVVGLIVFGIARLFLVQSQSISWGLQRLEMPSFFYCLQAGHGSW
jgi:hypothetical protein